MQCGGKISEIDKYSVAEHYGLRQGDIILSINGRQLDDMIDYLFLSTEKHLTLRIVRQDRPRTLQIEKEEGQPLGIAFENVVFDKIKVCKNKCDFCFVDQTAPQSRQTMNIKDDDFRLSFLWGNFITLTNLEETDWEKIKEYHLSPLYISVHAADGQIREQIFKNPRAGEILAQIKRLADYGITLHCQIVLCPGINDGKILVDTLEKLLDFYPHIASCAIVPVGLTKYHKQPSKIRTFTKVEMKAIIDLVKPLQKKFQKRYQQPVIFLGDEFYIKTETELPPYRQYGDFPQIENGVGMMRMLLTEFNRKKRFLPQKIKMPRHVDLVTGMLSGEYLEKIAQRLNEIENLTLTVYKIKNRFWGESVDVTGLLSGKDIEDVLKEKSCGDFILIPSICVNPDGLFLDGHSLEQMEKKLEKKVITIKENFSSLAEVCVNGIAAEND